MGQQQPTNLSTRKKSFHQEARIESLYEMYAQSIRLGTMVKPQSIVQKQSQYKQSNKQKQKQKQRKKQLESQQQFLQQLVESFQQRKEYSWGQEIPYLFKKHFSQGFEEKWSQSKEFFYELLLQNVGVELQSHELVQRSHIVVEQKERKLQRISKSPRQHSHNSKKQQQEENSFQDYFHKVIRERDSFQIRGSFMQNDEQITRRKQEEEIAEVQSQRMTLQEEINFINQSIIDAEQTNCGKDQSQHNAITEQEHNDDEYFLPLITKRRQQKKKLSTQNQQDRNSSLSYQEQQIEMGHMPSTHNYSRIRLQAASVIVPSTIFYERMNFSAKVETDHSLRVYRQLSNTIQQTVNSSSLISCPLKHFLLYFEHKTSKKKINQGNHSQGSIKSERLNHNSSDQNISIKTKQTIASIKTLKRTESQKQMGSLPLTSRQQTISHSQGPQDLQQILCEMSQRSEIIRKKRQFNTNFLLKQIKQFTEAYTEFLFRYLNFMKIEETHLSNFINLDTVYGVVLRNIWNIVTWIADRGYEWEEHALKEVVLRESQQFETFSQQEVQNNHHIVLQKYAKFCNKDMKKIKIQPQRFYKAYMALLKLKNEIFPQKYLKKIIIFYRQATKCCQGADDLMALYEFLLKNCILSDLSQQLHIFRMKNIIDKLIPIESSIDGAGEIVYAWTTWNIILEMFMLKLKDYKMELLAERESKVVRLNDVNRNTTKNKQMTEKKKRNGEKRQKQSFTDSKQQIEVKSTSSNINRQVAQKTNQNPQRRPEKQEKFSLTQCNQTK